MITDDKWKTHLDDYVARKIKDLQMPKDSTKFDKFIGNHQLNVKQ
jgi:hypothetical protein